MLIEAKEPNTQINQRKLQTKMQRKKQIHKETNCKVGDPKQLRGLKGPQYIIYYIDFLYPTFLFPHLLSPLNVHHLPLVCGDGKLGSSSATWRGGLKSIQEGGV